MKVQNTFKITLCREELEAIACYLEGHTYAMEPEVMVTSEGLLFGHDELFYSPDENQQFPERLFDKNPGPGAIDLVYGEDDLPF